MTDSGCIWCLDQASGPHREHIFPEVIGCPDGFILPGSVVCRKCNNGLAFLDQAVADEFDFASFMAGVPRKKGGPPSIKSRGNVVASVEDSVPTFTFNMEAYPVSAHDGSALAPYRGSRRNVRSGFSRAGNAATVSFSVPFGDNPKFVRGLTKIGFSTLAYFLGAPLARDPRFKHIREFVRFGSGNRHVLLTEANDAEYRNSAWPPYVSEIGGYAVTFRIARIEFLADLTPDESLLPMLEAKAKEQFGEARSCTIPRRC